MGVIFFEWIIAWSMIVDTRAVLPGSAGYWGAAAWKLAMWAAVFLLMRRVLRDGRAGRPVRTAVGAARTAGAFAAAQRARRSRCGTSAPTPLHGVDELIDAAFYTLLPFVFVSSIALLFAVVLLARHQALEQEHQLADMRELYYQGIRREQEQVRRLRHDMRNHLTALSGLLEAGGGAAARQTMCAACRQASGPAGSRTLYGQRDGQYRAVPPRRATWRRPGLEADISVSLPEKLPVADPDLCALFGNALDNAAEAAQDAPDKRVTVRARADKGLLMLRVRNALQGERQQAADGLFATTKADRRAHGFGLRGMREIAARYGGTLETTAQDGVFELIACLPLQHEKTALDASKAVFLCCSADTLFVGCADRGRQLIRAAGALAAARNALEIALDLLDGHALDHAADRLQVAVAPAEEGHVVHLIPVQVK